MAAAKAPVSDTVRFLFQEFDEDKDGWLTRREFFHFLVDVRPDPTTRLTEGQMISCWSAVPKERGDAGPISLAEFAVALEKMYATHFFAAENGVPIPAKVNRTSKDASLVPFDQSSMYNTIKFKKSPAVAIFDELIEEEKRLKEEREREKARHA